MTEEEKLEAWQQAAIVLGNDEKQYRKDLCGAWMQWGMYANHESEFGWEIARNNRLGLLAFQWQNLPRRNNAPPTYTITAYGSHNKPNTFDSNAPQLRDWNND